MDKSYLNSMRIFSVIEKSEPHKAARFTSVHLFWQESSSSFQYLPLCFVFCPYPLISYLKSYRYLYIATIPSDTEDSNKNLAFLFLPMKFSLIAFRQIVFLELKF